MRISDWSSDVCSSDLRQWRRLHEVVVAAGQQTLEKGLRPVERGQEEDGTAAQPLQLADAAAGFDAVHARHHDVENDELRSEERRGGKECVSQCRCRWLPYH